MRTKLGNYYLIRFSSGKIFLSLCYKEPKTDEILVEMVECLNYAGCELFKGADLQDMLENNNVHVDLIAEFGSYKEYLDSEERGRIMGEVADNVQIVFSKAVFDPEMVFQCNDNWPECEVVVEFKLVYRDEVLVEYSGEYHMVTSGDIWNFGDSELDKRWYEFMELEESLRNEVCEKFIGVGQDYMGGLEKLGESLVRENFIARCKREGVGYWD